ncbi:MAG: glycerol-3-phosphate acyltransferase [Rhodobacterales bacterium]|nr:MAG: glycerol-3-phosphate acyltransferase [Rhodobacterales bacterium]
MPEILSNPQMLALAALAGYVLGSIPFGLVMARLMGLGDLRQIGSGNIGATNVLRTGNKTAAAATLLFDAAKGGVAVLLAGYFIGLDAAQIAGAAAFLGHLFPVWLGFAGGKGVATFLGILLALNWMIGLLACLSWLVMTLIFRISSLSALTAAALTPVWAVVLGQDQILALVIVLGLLIYLRHSANIKRLLNGTEPKIGGKK